MQTEYYLGLGVCIQVLSPSKFLYKTIRFFKVTTPFIEMKGIYRFYEHIFQSENVVNGGEKVDTGVLTRSFPSF